MRLVIVVKSWFRVLEKNSCVQSPAQEEMGGTRSWVLVQYFPELPDDWWMDGLVVVGAGVDYTSCILQIWTNFVSFFWVCFSQVQCNWYVGKDPEPTDGVCGRFFGAQSLGVDNVHAGGSSDQQEPDLRDEWRTHFQTHRILVFQIPRLQLHCGVLPLSLSCSPNQTSSWIPLNCCLCSPSGHDLDFFQHQLERCWYLGVQCGSLVDQAQDLRPVSASLLLNPKP